MKTTVSTKRAVSMTVGALMFAVLLTGAAPLLGNRLDLTRAAQAGGESKPTAASGEKRQYHCSNETLAGRYAVKGDGFVRFGPPTAPMVPFATVSLMTLDGEGGLSNQVTRSINGTISSGVDPGIYNVNSDCTGTMTIGSLTFDLVVADLKGAAAGREFYFIATTPGGVVTASAKRIQ